MSEILALPATIQAMGITLRPIFPADIEFLRRLYVSTRWNEMRLAIGWTDNQRHAFLVNQAALPHLCYMKHASDTDFGILECGDEPLGRLYIRRIGRDELRLVDIALMPDWRRRGLGTALLRAVMEKARSDGRFVSIHVERNNPARHLYGRLGFRVMEHKGVHDFLVWNFSAPATGG